MTAVLLDHFDGDPAEFYAVCQEEMTKYAIPDLAYDWQEEERGRRMFKGPEEKVTCLNAQNGVYKAKVIAYCYGSHFYISLRTGFYASIDGKQKEEQGKWEELDHIRASCFDTLIERGFQKALSRYLEEKQRPVPDALKPENVFIVEKEQKKTA